MNNIYSLFDLLLIDIETVPQFSSVNLLANDSRQLFFDKISKTVPEKFDEEELYKQKAGILAEFGRVICISIGFFYFDKGERVCLKIKSVSGHDEALLLKEFIDVINIFYKHKPRFQFGGHNIREFDIPFLCRRMLINQIPLPASLNIYGARPWDVYMADTLQWWRFGDFKNYTSLNLLASVLGIPTSKDDIDGSMVQHVYYKENNLERIVKYCQKDVVVAARVIQRFKNLPLVEDDNIFYS